MLSAVRRRCLRAAAKESMLGPIGHFFTEVLPSLEVNPLAPFGVSSFENGEKLGAQHVLLVALALFRRPSSWK